MNRWKCHAETGCDSGVYLIDATLRDAILELSFTHASPTLVILDVEAISGREAFFDVIARSLAFPGYFGRNWDAVNDCLTDPSVMPANGVVIVVDDYDRFARVEPDQWSICLKVFQDACAFWQSTDRPFYVLLNGPSDDAPESPVFPLECLVAWSTDA
jgi:RNAse (barnase) inhibitor barstar